MTAGSDPEPIANLRHPDDVALSHPLTVSIAIGDHLLHVAIESTLRLAHITLVATPIERPNCFHITDDLQSTGAQTVLLCDESPVEAYAAILAFSNRHVRAIASRRRPEVIATVIEAASQGLAVIPPSLIEAAFHAPRLSDQHIRVLALTIEGLTNQSIGKRLGISEASVKRVVSSLLRSFEASTRTELVQRAASIGFSRTSRTWNRPYGTPE